MRLRYLVIASFMILVVSACSKKKNQKLAQTHFKMAFLELSDIAEPAHSNKKALAQINKALEYDEKPEFYALKATVLFNAGSYEESEACFQRAIALQPDLSLQADIANNRACLFAQKGDQQSAKNIWERLLCDTSYQTPEVALVNLGKLYAQQQQPKKAKKLFVRAISVAPSFVDAHFYHALMAKQLGHTAEARDSLKTVLLLEPEHMLADRMAKELGLYSHVGNN